MFPLHILPVAGKTSWAHQGSRQNTIARTGYPIDLTHLELTQPEFIWYCKNNAVDSTGIGPPNPFNF